MVAFIHNCKTYYLPESFNELSGKQFFSISKLMLTSGDHSLKALRILLDVSLYRFFLIPLDAKAEMQKHIAWVFGENTLTNQLMPHYRGRHAPKHNLDNLTLAEFHFCEFHYQEIATGNLDSLDKLVAVLYRTPVLFYNKKRDSKGDIRKPFNANEIEFNSAKIKRWPAHIKQAILIWYDGCRQALMSLYEDVFSGSEAQEQMQENIGMFNVIRNLAGDRFGTIAQVETIMLHTALYEIELTIQENKRQKAQFK